MFIVHNELDDGWMWVTNVRTEEQGLIVEDLVEEVVSDILFILLKVVSPNYYGHLHSKLCELWIKTNQC